MAAASWSWNVARYPVKYRMQKSLRTIAMLTKRMNATTPNNPDSASGWLLGFARHAAKLPSFVHSFHQSRRTTAQPKKEMPMTNFGPGDTCLMSEGQCLSVDHLVVNTNLRVL